MPEIPEKGKTTGACEPLSNSPIAEARIGVYVCDCGGNISDVVQCDQVVSALGGLRNVAVSRRYQFMCSDPGQKLITDDIREGRINRVVVGACSMFLHEQTFRKTLERAGLNPYLYCHIGLREQDSWVHHECAAEATDKAIRMMSAGVAKARLMQPLEAIHLDAEKHALVIGGGMAGLRAALSIARCRIKVTLIEKSHFLGGHVAQWEHVFPSEEDARAMLQNLRTDLLAQPNVTVLTGTEVVDAKGYVGNFKVCLRKQPRGVPDDFAALDQAIAACPVQVLDEFNFGLTKRKAIYRADVASYPAGGVIDRGDCTHCGECLRFNHDDGINLDEQPVEIELNVGAIVVATGFQPYVPFKGELGYGEYPQVITLPQLERLLATLGPSDDVLRWNGQPIRSMAMIHCVGSRQIEGVHQPQSDGKVNEYCSRVCCTATLAAANTIRKDFPDVNIYDLYQDIRTYGRGHEDYYIKAAKNRVTFMRYLAEEPPQVVMAEKNADHPLLLKLKDRLTWGEEIEIPVDLVVLSVGMMPSPVQDLVELLKISPGNDRFLLEVHPKLRPVETAVAGVVLAGTAQGPMNIQETCAAAQAAASKVAVLLGQGQVELEPYVARVDPERCQGAGECVRLCPQEGAIHLQSFSKNGNSFQQAVVTAANCNGCGVCASACPHRAIDIQGWRLDEFEAMVEAIAAKQPVLGVG